MNVTAKALGADWRSDIEQRRAANGPPPLIELEYCDDEPPKPVRYVVHGLLPEESCIIVGGEPKVGKSLTTLYLALCVLTGRKAFDRFPVAQGPVLIFSAEGAKRSRKRRLWELALGMGLDPREVVPKVGFFCIRDGSRFDLQEPETIEAMRSIITEVRPRLVVLDPFAACAPGIDENDNGAVGKILGPLRQVTTEVVPEMCLAVVHHVGKGHQGKSLQYALRGASALGGWNDGVVIMRLGAEDPEGARRVDVQLRDGNPPAPFGIRKLAGLAREDWGEHPLSRLELEDEVPSLDHAPGNRGRKLDNATLEQVFEVVANSGGIQTRWAGAKSVGMEPKKFNRYFDALRAAGRVSLTASEHMVVANSGGNGE